MKLFLRFTNPTKQCLLGMMTATAEVYSRTEDGMSDTAVEMEIFSIGLMVVQLDIIW